MNKYTGPQRIRISFTLTSYDTGELTDATNVVAKVVDPTGNADDVSDTVIRISTGSYYFDYLAELKGIYTYEAVSSGPVSVPAKGTFQIKSIAF